MPIPVRPLTASANPAYQVMATDDGSRTLVKNASQDSFHSGCGALAETRHVYLQNSGVAQRLAQGLSTRVLEVGVGTTMGMLLTLDAAICGKAELDYTGLESDWVSADVLEQLEPRSWIEHPQLADDLVRWRAAQPSVPPPGVYAHDFDSLRRVRVIVGDAVNWIHSGDESRFDAIYFDPFAPASCPELWSAQVLANMRAALSPGGRLVTYCCSRVVRDTLASVGFQVQRLAGPPGGKREVLVACSNTPLA